MNELSQLFRLFLLSMVPVSEYQVTIPLGVAKYHLSPWLVYLVAVAGSLAPMVPLYFCLIPLRNLCARLFPTYISYLDRHLDRARARLADDYNKYGALALFIALVIPFPFTGIWTMTAAAIMLRLPFTTTMLGLGLGLAAGAAMVLLLTLGTVHVVWFLR